MMKRSLFVLGLVGCMSSFASAQVFIEYWAAGDTPDGVNQPIDFDNSGGDVTQTINIGLTAPGGANQTAGADFVMSWPANLDVTNFQWSSTSFPGALGWFPDNTLPLPAISTFGLPVDVPVGPDPQLAMATVDVTVTAAMGLGLTQVTMGPTVNAGDFSEHTLISGSGAIPINVIPEPATMALLMLGGLSVLRRRRS